MVLAGVAAAAALLWPARAIGLLDGAPLDGSVEALLVGIAMPALWWFDPSFLRRRGAIAIIVMLMGLKIAGSVLLTQHGWCVRFTTDAPLAVEASPRQLSWDARTDWMRATPRCSAIAARPYTSFTRFPAWFMNLQNTRPPNVNVHMTVDGYVAASEAGELDIAVGGSTAMTAAIGDRRVGLNRPGRVGAPVASGVTHVQAEVDYAGSQWSFVPTWNDQNLYTSVATTIDPPSRADWLATPFSFLVTALSLGLLAWWAVHAAASVRPPALLVGWMLASSIVAAAAGVGGREAAARLLVVALIGAVAFRVPPRLQTIRGAFLLVGLPWLALFAGIAFAHIGRITLYSVGDDWLEFQRFAHRIYMQGYWMEGGQRTFWFQPLYRWVAGALHIVFGDSSVGEIFLDAAALLAGALFAFDAVASRRGFRWGIAAAAATLITIAITPIWYIIGRGLSEILAAGLAYTAALCLLRMPARPRTFALTAAACVMLALFTRLNAVPFLLSLAAFALPETMRAADFGALSRVGRALRPAPALVIAFAVIVALLLLTLRTWHYTGVVNPFYGTQAAHLSTVQSTGAGATLRRMAASALVVITMQDPPRLDPRDILVLAGVAVAALGVLGVPRFRDVPLPLAIVCLGGIVGSLVARGSSYLGRFSVHLVPVAVALVCCAVPATVPVISNKEPT